MAGITYCHNSYHHNLYQHNNFNNVRTKTKDALVKVPHCSAAYGASIYQLLDVQLTWGDCYGSSYTSLGHIIIIHAKASASKRKFNKKG